MYRYNRINCCCDFKTLMKCLPSGNVSFHLDTKLRDLFIERYYFQDFSLFDSGRQALYNLLSTSDGRRKEVIIPAICCAVLPATVRSAGKIPVYADIDPGRFSMDFEDVGRRITRDTAAVIVVHEFGIPASRSGMKGLRGNFDGIIVEDAAIALGSRYADGSPVGGVGDFTIFSGGLGKPVSAASWGGLGARKKGMESMVLFCRARPSLSSFLRIIALQMMTAYPVYNTVRPLLLKKVREDAVEFPERMKRPSRLDNSLMVRHMEKLDALHRFGHETGKKCIEILKRWGIRSAATEGLRPMYARIPIVLPTEEDRVRFEQIFERWGIEVQRPYQESLQDCDRSEYPFATELMDTLLTLTIHRNPRFFGLLKLAARDYRFQVSDRSKSESFG